MPHSRGVEALIQVLYTSQDAQLQLGAILQWLQRAKVALTDNAGLLLCMHVKATLDIEPII